MRALPSAGARAGGAVRGALAPLLRSIECTVRGQQRTAACKCTPGGWRSARRATTRCTTHCMCFASVACVPHRPRRRTSLLDAYHQRTGRWSLAAMCACRDIVHGGQLHQALENVAKKGALQHRNTK